MLFTKYLPENRIREADKKEYKEFLFRYGYWRALCLFSLHVKNIICRYIKYSKEEKKNSYIHIFFGAVDYPILTINTRR